MPYGIEYLSKEQIKLVKERLSKGGVVTSELMEDLLDHFCVAIEEEMKQGRPFQSAFNYVFDTLQEDELKTTEMKTQELLEGKKIFYPNLLQSFGLLLLAFMISWVVSLTVQAIAIGEENVEVRAQWLSQNYLLIFEISSILTFGGTIGYAIWKIRRTQVSMPIFSFRSVPTYVYGVLLLIVIFSRVWLEPIAIFPPFFQEFKVAHLSRLEAFSPWVILLLTIFNVTLVELLLRGIILKGLLMTMTPLRAILWSSLFCALLGYPYFASYFTLNLMLGWIYWKTRSLYPTIFLFAAGFIIIYIISLFMDHPKDFFLHFSLWEYLGKNLVIYIPLVVGSFLITAGLFYYLHRKLSPESSV